MHLNDQLLFVFTPALMLLYLLYQVLCCDSVSHDHTNVMHSTLVQGTNYVGPPLQYLHILHFPSQHRHHHVLPPKELHHNLPDTNLRNSSPQPSTPTRVPKYGSNPLHETPKHASKGNLQSTEGTSTGHAQVQALSRSPDPIQLRSFCTLRH